jgi:thymidylate synthase (FAD)
VFDPLVEDTFGLFESEPTPAGEMVEHVLDIVQNLYKELLNAGVAKECARMILPMATQTTLYMTGSVRSWIHFIQIRDDVHAQKEAQIIAREIKDIFIDQLPIISSALDFKKQNYQPV